MTNTLSIIRVAIIAAVAVALTIILSPTAFGQTTDINIALTHSPNSIGQGDTVQFTVFLTNPTNQTISSMASTFWGPTGSTITSTSRSGGAKGPQWDNGTQWGRPTWDWGAKNYPAGFRETFTVTVRLVGENIHKCGTTYGASYQDWTPIDPVTHTQFTTTCPERTKPTPQPTPEPTPKIVVKEIVIENNAVQKQVVEQKVIVHQAAAKAAPKPKPGPKPQPQVAPVRVTATTGPSMIALAVSVVGGIGLAASRRFLA